MASSIQDVLMEAEEHVLSTLEKDGSRRWLYPKLSVGKLWYRRRLVAYFLIAVFTLVPFVKIGGKPLLLLDLPARKFTIVGYTFLPTDTVMLALLLVSVLLSIFLVTALFGRVWCGWACPQTVYMEFVFRPIERWIEGTAGRGGPNRKVAGWRLAIKYLIFAAISFYLANTFLAYFVGVERLGRWITSSPLEQPVPFLIVMFVTGLMLFDFGYFREQLCIIACPYGRFQSVLLDRNSLIVSYDQQRGEPRGKLHKGDALPVTSGDCIDCKLCVVTCPTGIDIRQGLQMECINCTQCIDACDAVMERIGRPKQLIRYSSQAADAGQKLGLIRARTVLYPALMSAAVLLLGFLFLTKRSFDAVVLREAGNPFTVAEDGAIQNLFRIKLTNRIDEAGAYAVELVEPEGARLRISEGEMSLAPYESRTYHLQVFTPVDVFVNGRSPIKLRLRSERAEQRALSFELLGPYLTGETDSAAAAAEQTAAPSTSDGDS
jgi:cytochrome c oxidase accessory protein FixG